MAATTCKNHTDQKDPKARPHRYFTRDKAQLIRQKVSYSSLTSDLKLQQYSQRLLTRITAF
ncbi:MULTISPECIES: hypothetical protein [Yersinia pseudotuberculosis complex]|uniref:hypothetical protein n=1 Tax=Yersinia pseudotuberculosis complex TaxID=1649845 RepID=UPI000907171D|nr:MULTISPECIES: hypothetical protein [Yersinia pseudotuberculosis complex]